MKKYALVGAAGAIGQSVAAALRNKGIAYRVIGRSMPSLQAAFGSDPLAEMVTWNPDDATSIRQALHDVDTVIYLVGVDYWAFHLHPVLIEKTLDAAIAENVQHFVLSGTVYPYGRPVTAKVDETHPRNPHTFKGKMRKAQEDILMRADREGKIKATVLRLPDFYGPGVDKSLLDSVFNAAAKGGRAMMVGPIDTPHEFVFVPDAGPALMRLAETPQAYGKIWHFAGSGIITQKEMAKRIFKQANSPMKAMVFSAWMVKIVGWFDRMMKELAEMEYLHTTPVIMDDRALMRLLPDLHKTSYDEGIRQTLEPLLEEARRA